MKYHTKTFSELTTKELYEILKLRADVFVVEQNCPYPDPDGKDQKAIHVMGLVGEELAAYARCFAPGYYFKECAIGRVVVSGKFRGKEYGKEIMKESVRQCETKYNAKEILVSAQKYLEKFYNELGFIAEGEVYLEDNIPHIKMRWKK
jgi:ElaA protein